jgi:hypothetical protein
LDQLVAVVQRRQAFAATYRRLKRQRQWLVELDRRLDPPEDAQPRPTRRSVKRQVKDFLANLEEYARHHPSEAKVVDRICVTVRQRWPRLFACYAWPERYRTNNDLETFFGRLRTRQRQIHGRKSVHEFILRYGEWAVFIDPTETFEQVLRRLQQFDQDQFDLEYDRFMKAQRRLHVLHRFRHHPRRCLKQLEQQWAEAVRRKSH